MRPCRDNTDRNLLAEWELELDEFKPCIHWKIHLQWLDLATKQDRGAKMATHENKHKKHREYT